MPKFSIIAYVFAGVFLVGCSDGTKATAPAITMIPTAQTPAAQTPTAQAPLPTPKKTESRQLPTVTIPATKSEPTISSNEGEILDKAVTNLLNATSFELSAHEVRAYQIIDAEGETRAIYGEFNTNYEVIRLPALKVHGVHEYRYDPQSDFLKFDSYTYQDGGKYLTHLDEAS
ncbi:MAG: hypothetical protein WA996_19050, partial [Candidatus Promineifilaceae bacterium]